VRASGIVRLVGTDKFADLYGTSISAASVPCSTTPGRWCWR
jgi:hypothetical protein